MLQQQHNTEISHLLSQDLAQRQKLIDSRSIKDCLNTRLVSQIEGEIEQEKVSHRIWVAIQIPQIHLDIVISKSVRLATEPCVMLSDDNKVIQMNDVAMLCGIQFGTNVSQLSGNLPKIRVLLRPSTSDVQEIENIILRQLQIIDRELEIDNTRHIFLLDATNYMAEKGESQAYQICWQIQENLLQKHKIKTLFGIGQNVLLCQLALQEATKDKSINIITGTNQHLHISLDKIPWLSQALIIQLRMMGVITVEDIKKRIESIQLQFQPHILKHLLKIYHGAARCYHEITGELDSMKVSRILPIKDYTKEEMQSYVTEIIKQLICDMKHYSRIAKSVKLLIIKADQNSISTKRDILRISTDYFELFLSECLQMVSTLNFPGMILYKVQIQIFELLPIEVIDNLNISFTMKLNKLLQQSGGKEDHQKKSFMIQNDNSSMLKTENKQLRKNMSPVRESPETRDRQSIAGKNGGLIEEKQRSSIPFNVNFNLMKREEESMKQKKNTNSMKQSSKEKENQNTANIDEVLKEYQEHFSSEDPLLEICVEIENQDKKSTVNETYINLEAKQGISNTIQKETSLFQNLFILNSSSSEDDNFEQQSNASEKPIFSKNDEDNNSNSKQITFNLKDQKKDYLQDKFNCPLCGKQIDCKSNFSLLNKHIDQCLLEQGQDQDSQTSCPLPTFTNKKQKKNESMRKQNILPPPPPSLKKRERGLGQKSKQKCPFSQPNSLLDFGFRK